MQGVSEAGREAVAVSLAGCDLGRRDDAVMGGFVLDLSHTNGDGKAEAYAQADEGSDEIAVAACSPGQK